MKEYVTMFLFLHILFYIDMMCISCEFKSALNFKQVTEQGRIQDM